MATGSGFGFKGAVDGALAALAACAVEVAAEGPPSAAGCRAQAPRSSANRRPERVGSCLSTLEGEDRMGKTGVGAFVAIAGKRARSIIVRPTMGTMSPIHWLLVAIVLLALFGPKTLTKVGRTAGRGMRTVSDVKRDLSNVP